MKEPEYRVRYRTRRELRGRDADEVAAATKAWVAEQTDEHARLEGLWVSWGIGKLDVELLKSLLESDDYHARAAAVKCLRYNADSVSEIGDLLLTAAGDENGRVRMEATVAATWMDKEVGLPIAKKAASLPLDDWSKKPIETSLGRLEGAAEAESDEPKAKVPKHLAKEFGEAYKKGFEIFHREGYCVTCHQPDGKGLPAAGFPPLAETEIVNGEYETMAKIVLHGLQGPIQVKGVDYPGLVPMTAFGGLLNDDEAASVMTYVRNSFGNKASPVTPKEIKKVRDEHKDRLLPWTAEDLEKDAKK